MQVILITAMEYLREEVVEKDEEEETASYKNRTIVVGKSSDKSETSSEDVEVSQPSEGWTEQGRKVSLVDRIKKIGKIQYGIYIWPIFDTNPTDISEKKVLPATVLIIGLIYASIAATFYFYWSV